MSYSLGRRNNMHAHHAEHARRMSTAILESSMASIWVSAKYPEYLDEYSAISGDDLARINAFERKVEPRLWADVTTHTVRAAA